VPIGPWNGIPGIDAGAPQVRTFTNERPNVGELGPADPRVDDRFIYGRYTNRFGLYWRSRTLGSYARRDWIACSHFVFLISAFSFPGRVGIPRLSAAVIEESFRERVDAIGMVSYLFEFGLGTLAFRWWQHKNENQHAKNEQCRPACRESSNTVVVDDSA
jgi:hypothetical protein